MLYEVITYGFNKSHSVAYGYITYWSAYLKANHPLEFAVALLNNTGSDEKSIHILRYLLETEGIKHIPYDSYNFV